MLNFKEYQEVNEFNKLGMYILEMDDMGMNESVSELEEMISEAAMPDKAISKTLQKDVKSMSKSDFTKITTTFAKLVKSEYSKNAKAKTTYLGRVRFISSTGKATEYPVLSISKEAQSKIKGDREIKLKPGTFRVLVDKKNTWRTITIDKMLGLVFKGKLFTLKPKDNDYMSKSQSSSLLDFAEKSADVKARQVEKVRNYLINLGINNEEDLPRLTSKDDIKKGLLANIKDDKTKEYKEVSKDFNLYSISITGYNYKTREVAISIKLDIHKIAKLKFNVDSIGLKNKPEGIKAAQWKRDVVSMKEEIINDIKAYNFDNVSIGTKYVNIEVKG